MKSIKYILLIAVILRLSVLFFSNLKTETYWEYGETAKNLFNDRGYSLFYFDGDTLKLNYNPHIIPEKSAFMPPGYVLFLYPFYSFDDVQLRNILIILVQTVFSSSLILLIFFYTKYYLGYMTAFIAASITAINPEFIISAASFTPTVFYQVLILSLLYLMHKYYLRQDVKTLIYITVLFIVLQLFRSEIILFALFFFGWLILSGKYTKGFVFILLIILSLIPWTYRNYLAFDRIIPFTTNFGINLYRGNNSIELGDWGTAEMIKQVQKESDTKPIELAYNDVYSKKAVSFIKENIPETAGNVFIKLFELWIFNLHDDRTENIIYRISSVIFFLLFVFGLRFFLKNKEFRFEKYYFLFFSIVVSIFFVLPRYQVMLRIAMIPFCAFALQFLFTKIKLSLKKDLLVRSD